MIDLLSLPPAICYTGRMTLSDNEKAERKQRHLESIKLHEIEGNPFTPEDFAMFEMFEREGWSDEQCRAYIIEQAAKRRDAGQSD